MKRTHECVRAQADKRIDEPRDHIRFDKKGKFDKRIVTRVTRVVESKA